MKTIKRIKGIRVRGIKTKVWRLKTKLTIPKLKKHPGHRFKKMAVSDKAIITKNIIDEANNNAEDISLEENVPVDENVSFLMGKPKQSGLKLRKKRLCNKEIVNQSSDHEHCTDNVRILNSERPINDEDNSWKLDISSEEEDDEDWVQFSAQEQRNLDSPILVQMQKDTNTLLNVPEIFEQRPKGKSKMDTCDIRRSFKQETRSNKSNMLIINTKSVKPKDNKHKESAFSIPWCVIKTNQTKDNETAGNNELGNNDLGTDASSSVYRESIEKRTSGNNNAKACDISRYKVINLLYSKRDRKQDKSNTVVSNLKDSNVNNVQSTDGSNPTCQESKDSSTNSDDDSEACYASEFKDTDAFYLKFDNNQVTATTSDNRVEDSTVSNVCSANLSNLMRKESDNSSEKLTSDDSDAEACYSQFEDTGYLNFDYNNEDEGKTATIERKSKYANTFSFLDSSNVSYRDNDHTRKKTVQKKESRKPKNLQDPKDVSKLRSKHEGNMSIDNIELENPNVSYIDDNLACKKPFTRKELTGWKKSSQDPKNTKSAKNDNITKGANEDASVHSRKEPQLYSIRNFVIVIMQKDAEFCFSGKLSVRVLYGAVEVYGAILNASKGLIEVYSPRGYSKVVVETSKEHSQDNIDDIWKALSVEGVTRDTESKLQEDMEKVESGMAVLTLRNIENNLTFFLKTHYPHELFPSVKYSGYYPWIHRHRAEIVLQARVHLGHHQQSSHKRLVFNRPVTSCVVDKMLTLWRANNWSCALVAGGKSVGKSTSVRFLINRLLHTCGKVVLVDVDPGQAECTPAGCISYSLIEQPLTGPNFTHLQTPAYQLFIDEINVVRCVTRYLEGLKMLLDQLKRCPVSSRLPIVVNTMGFTQHIGWDLAIFTIKLFRPSVILQISSSKKKNYKSLLSADIVNKQKRKWTFCDEMLSDWNRPCEHELYVTQSKAEEKQSSNEWNMEPYQQRELVMMSYLSDILRDKYNPFRSNENLPLSINEAVPCKAPFSSLCIIPQRLFGVPTAHALSVINGNIVALCGIDLAEESSQESDDTSGLRVLTQRSPLCTCYGFGIIRGVDMEQQEVFVNTPLPMSMMQHVNCLAGCIPIPPILLQLSQNAPYVGANATLRTSREPRKGYFRIKRQMKPNNS